MAAHRHGLDARQRKLWLFYVSVIGLKLRLVEAIGRAVGGKPVLAEEGMRRVAVLFQKARVRESV